MALGVISDAVFSAAEATLGPGDRLLLYTDGLTEASNTADEEFGEARLLAVLEARRGANGNALIAEVIADVLRFCGPVRPRDDMTVLSLTREA
jgi:sigma-B regulation protein RsbU (phosphoserine phosphatase)